MKIHNNLYGKNSILDVFFFVVVVFSSYFAFFVDFSIVLPELLLIFF